MYIITNVIILHAQYLRKRDLIQCVDVVPINKNINLKILFLNVKD